MSAPQLLAGRLALVTGAGQGNGRAIALGLAAHGADVVVTDIDTAAAQQTADDVSARGRRGWSYTLDVTDAEACAALAKTVTDDIGPVAILVNNAGIIIRETIDSVRAHDNWRRVLDVNLNGVFNVTHAFLPALRQTHGSIINIGSIASFVGVADTLGYSPSKGGVKLLTQSLARELARDGIRVNAIAPGAIDTPMLRRSFARHANSDEVREDSRNRHAMKRFGQAEEIAQTALHLASDASSFTTGTVMVVDGGWLAA